MSLLTRSSTALFLSGLLLSFIGCERPAQPQGPTSAEVSGDDLAPIWDAALAVLRKHEFHPDRQDRAQGVITTLPTTSMQWGEFWRQDVADAYGYGESSLHTIQRQVTVKFIRDKQWRVEVQVDVYRLNMPESQITTASSAFQAFSGALPDTQGTLQLHGAARRTWVHLGRDGSMESRLLQRILATAGAAA